LAQSVHARTVASGRFLPSPKAALGPGCVKTGWKQLTKRYANRFHLYQRIFTSTYEISHAVKSPSLINPLSGLSIRQLGVCVRYQVMMIRPNHRPGSAAVDLFSEALRTQARKMSDILAKDC